MTLKLSPQLEAALSDHARRRGIAPEQAAVEALRERFLPVTPLDEPQDEWERRLRDVAVDCGVSISNEALSSEGLYD